MKSRAIYFAALVAVIALLAVRRKAEIAAAFVALYMQVSLYTNNYFFVGLFMPGFSPPNPHLPALNMGEWNILQMKLIYVARYLFKDQFLFHSVSDSILKNIETRLDTQYRENNWSIDEFHNISVPSAAWSDIDADTYHAYVTSSTPFVIKHFPSVAMKHWSPAALANRFGEHRIDVINMTSVSVLSMTLREYVDIHNEGNQLKDVLYIRALSSIFDDHKELLDELAVLNFTSHMRSRYITSQIFMGMSATSGTSYHCANFNNLFFQVAGRKKWTFVAPQYNILMYPMFNAKSMDVASFLSTIALASDETMEKYYPLYKYAPKMVATLEPGDVLFNPPWQWHMIENLESESIGVASRWFLAAKQMYQNSVHSTLQFLSPYVWKTYFDKAYNLQKGIRVHKASNTPPIDERFNFGKPGSAVQYRPKIFPAHIYQN